MESSSSLAADLTQVHGEQHERCQLTGERFRRRDTNFRASVGQDRPPQPRGVIAEPATLQIAIVF